MVLYDILKLLYTGGYPSPQQLAETCCRVQQPGLQAVQVSLHLVEACSATALEASGSSEGLGASYSSEDLGG